MRNTGTGGDGDLSLGADAAHGTRLTSTPVELQAGTTTIAAPVYAHTAPASVRNGTGSYAVYNAEGTLTIHTGSDLDDVSGIDRIRIQPEASLINRLTVYGLSDFVGDGEGLLTAGQPLAR